MPARARFQTIKGPQTCDRCDSAALVGLDAEWLCDAHLTEALTARRIAAEEFFVALQKQATIDAIKDVRSRLLCGSEK